MGFLIYPLCGYILLWSVLPLSLLSLTASLPTPNPIFQLLEYMSLYPLPSQMLYITILLTLYHSLFLSSFSEFHSYKHVLYICLYMIIFVLVYMFTFWILNR
jgi:hypothetical protein